MTKDAFAQTLNAYTEDNEVLVIHTCPETEVDCMSMMNWWKAEDPGEFKMGCEEYWKSAELGNHMIPPRDNPFSATELMNVKDIMPRPWKDMQTERGGNAIGKR